MAVVVLVPTFQRPETLEWSLRSVLSQDLRGIGPNQEFRVVILNNDVSTRQLVDDAVKKTLTSVAKVNSINVRVVHRDPPLLAVSNFYQGLAENTREGDFAIIHGDDDIMLPGSLAKRWLVARESNAAFNIAKVTAGVFFFRHDRDIYLKDREATSVPENAPRWRQAVKDDLVDYCLPFVSAYCYRMGPEFWACHRLAMKWAQTLPLEPKIRLPFLPFYMGLAAWMNKQLVVIPEVLIRRGQLLQSRGLLPPRVVTEYANTGIILQTGLAVLNNEDLSPIMELDGLRGSFRKTAAGYLFFSLFKRDGVSLSQLGTLYRLTKMRWWSRELLFRVIFGASSKVVKNGLGVTNLCNRLSGWGHRFSPEDFWVAWDECEH